MIVSAFTNTVAAFALGLIGGLLADIALLGGLVFGPFVAERRVVVEGDLGVECVHATVWTKDERVDLDEIGIAIHVGVVQLQQDADRTVLGRGVQRGGLHPFAGGGLVETVDRIDPDLRDGVRIVSGNRLDLDATLR